MPLLRALVRYGYAPFMLLGVNGLALAAVSAAPWTVALPPLMLLALAASFAAERLVPYRESWNGVQPDSARDVLHALVNESSNAVSLAAFPLFAGTFALADAWPSRLPFAVQVLIAVLVFDCGITLVHAASHRVGWLWRFHAVHHSVTRLYGFNGLLKHPVHQGIEVPAGIAPLIALGLPHRVAAAVSVLTFVQLLMQHSNADYRIGFLARHLALNEAHRSHHRCDGHRGNVNFGLFTNLWDRLLGTMVFEENVRFESRDLGVAHDPEYPVGWAAQMIRPFRDLRN